MDGADAEGQTQDDLQRIHSPKACGVRLTMVGLRYPRCWVLSSL